MNVARSLRTTFADLPLLPRYALATATVIGALGGLAGLVLGLSAYPPTAWFAVFEVGVPAFVLGLVIGLLAGSARLAVRTMTKVRTQR